MNGSRVEGWDSPSHDSHVPPPLGFVDFHLSVTVLPVLFSVSTSVRPGRRVLEPVPFRVDRTSTTPTVAFFSTSVGVPLVVPGDREFPPGWSCFLPFTFDRPPRSGPLLDRSFLDAQ